MDNYSPEFQEPIDYDLIRVSYYDVDKSAADVSFNFNHLQISANDASHSHQLMPESAETGDEDQEEEHDDEEEDDFTFTCVGDNDLPITDVVEGGDIRQHSYSASNLFSGDYNNFRLDLKVSRICWLHRQEEWRVHMLPIQFLFLTCNPVIDMRSRCKTNGHNYPTGVPPQVTKVLDLDIIRWELHGIEDIVKPSEFSLGVKGALYPYRQGNLSRLKGQLTMSITFDLPPVLGLIPEDVRRDVAETVRS